MVLAWKYALRKRQENKDAALPHLDHSRYYCPSVEGGVYLYKWGHEKGVEGTDAQVAAPRGRICWVEVIRHTRYSSVLHPVFIHT